MPEAARENELSCTVTPVIAANTQPAAAMLAPKRRAEEKGSGFASEKKNVRDMRNPATRFITTVRPSAARSCVWRPTTFALSSSARPVCSSARVCRVIVVIDIRAAPSMRKTPYMPTTKRGIVISSIP